MGANQSGMARPQPKETLYDLLGVDRTADASALKRAYRMRALELHPDRNFGHAEEATANFAKVQAAYDILTNIDERKWYDSHEDDLGYHEYNQKVTKTSEILAYLNPAFQRTLDPNKDEMYRLASEFFERLKHEEFEAAFDQGRALTDIAVHDAPPFGHIDTPWSEVKRFYDIWGTFVTIKRFEWEDVYPVHHALDRRSRRDFENKNRHLREAAKKIFSKNVRNIVSDLRQADVRKPRPSKAEKPPAPKPKTPRNIGEYQEQQWTEVYVKKLDEADNLDCIACGETFSTAEELHLHELKPSHNKAVAELRREMLNDDRELQEQMDSLEVNDIVSAMGRYREKPVKPAKAKPKSKSQKKKKKQEIVMKCPVCEEEFESAPQLQMHHRMHT